VYSHVNVGMQTQSVRMNYMPAIHVTAGCWVKLKVRSLLTLSMKQVTYGIGGIMQVIVNKICEKNPLYN